MTQSVSPSRARFVQDNQEKGLHLRRVTVMAGVSLDSLLLQEIYLCFVALVRGASQGDRRPLEPAGLTPQGRQRQRVARDTAVLAEGK